MCYLTPKKKIFTTNSNKKDNQANFSDPAANMALI